MPALALYVDLKNAYNAVWHAELMTRLNKLEIPLELLKLNAPWLENLQAYVCFGKKRSEKFEIEVGLSQGSSLSPSSS
jgi:hypothetical protein